MKNTKEVQAILMSIEGTNNEHIESLKDLFFTQEYSDKPAFLFNLASF